MEITKHQGVLGMDSTFHVPFGRFGQGLEDNGHCNWTDTGSGQAIARTNYPTLSTEITPHSLRVLSSGDGSKVAKS